MIAFTYQYGEIVAKLSAIGRFREISRYLSPLWAHETTQTRRLRYEGMTLDKFFRQGPIGSGASATRIVFQD